MECIWNALFNDVQRTPLVLQSFDLVIDGNWEADTTNFMVHATKSLTDDEIHVAISNYNSSIQDYSINLQNLPFDSSDQLKVTTYIVRAPSDKFTQNITNLTGSDSLHIPIVNMPAPSIAYTNRKDGTNNIDLIGVQKPIIKAYPNPHTSHFQIELDKTYQSIKSFLYNMNGKLITTKSFHNRRKLEYRHEIPNGVYQLKLLLDGETTTSIFIIRN